MVEYADLMRENSTKILKIDKALRGLLYVRGCILEVNPDELGW